MLYSDGRNEGVKTFYEKFATRLLKDYFLGNARIEAAIKFAISFIPRPSLQILDIGCGIGWSTWEIKRHCPKANILGIDMSSESIKIATRLFGTGGSLHFSTHDIIDGVELNGTFDAITMIDCYEHISKESRFKLHSFLDKLLKDNGILILTCPSVFHQTYLRESKAHQLQPIDEDILIDDMLKLSSDIKGYIAYFAYKDIWHKNDYLYVVIKRNTEQYNKRIPDRNRYSVNLEPPFIRRFRVLNRFGLNQCLKNLISKQNGAST